MSAVRKAVKTVVPPLFLMTLFNYVARTNVAYSYLKDSFVERLGFTDASYGLASGLFYVTYVAMQPIATYFLGTLGRPQLFIGSMSIVWGATSMGCAFVATKEQFFALRLLLGAAESIALPGIWYFLSRFIGS